MGLGDYVLGTRAEELERLRFQHELWAPLARAAWRRAGLTAGQRVLEIGAGPGFAALELARAVGPDGHVLALERSGAYLASGRTAAVSAGLAQLSFHCHDLLAGPLAPELTDPGFDLLWCRWVAMFLPQLDPLLELMRAALRPGGRLVIHEYVHWSTFALHPHGTAIGRFGEQVQRSFRAAGGDPDVNRRLPSLLAARGFAIEDLRPLPVLGPRGSMAAQWMERFVAVYGAQLRQQGLWSAADAATAAAEIAAAQGDPGSYWVGPTVLELRARG
jgi:SAM-dependent methyltransferase